MSIAFREYGQPGRPAVVLLHGGGVSGWSWDLQLPALQAYHVLVPDLPEHGRSQQAGPLTIESAAAEVAELIARQVPSGKAHAAGLSLGGQTALDLLARFPERLCSALLSGVLVSPPGSSNPWVRPLPRALLKATLAAYMPFRNWGWLVRANMKSLGVPLRFEPQMAEDTHRIRLDAFMHLMDANQHYLLPDTSRAAAVPALVLAGEREPAVIHRSQRQILNALPSARGGLVQGAVHNWPLASPDLFNQTLTAWLEDRPLPDGIRPVNR